MGELRHARSISVVIGAELESDCVTPTNITPRQQLFAAINDCEAVGNSQNCST